MSDAPLINEDLLSAFIDGELDAETHAAVEARLVESPEWRAVLADVAAARAAVRALPTREPPPRFIEDLIATVAADATGTTGARRDKQRVPRRRGPMRWAAAGAAAAAVAAGIAVFAVPGPSRTAPQVPTLTDSHAAQASQLDDPVSQLAPVSAFRGFRR